MEREEEGTIKGGRGIERGGKKGTQETERVKVGRRRRKGGAGRGGG